jgi:hypothetical protein
MIKVLELIPGMIVEMGGMSATFITKDDHPEYGSTFSLVVWKIHGGPYSFDALSWHQVVGEVQPFTRPQLLQNLKEALGVDD